MNAMPWDRGALFGSFLKKRLFLPSALIKRCAWTALILGTAMGSSAGSYADSLRWTQFGARPLGMGNAFVAVADDYNALFYNPAGLARLKDWDGEFLNPYFEVSQNTSSFFGEISSLSGGSGGGTEKVLTLLEKQTGKTHHLALGFTPHLVFPGWGFGIGTELVTSMAVHREISADLDVGPRILAPIAFAQNFFQDKLSIGMGVKFAVKGGIDREFSIEDIGALSSSDAEKEATGDTNKKTTQLSDFFIGGYGMGFDMGLLFTPIKPMEPTLGISIMDLGGTPYEKLDVGGTAVSAPDLRLPAVNTGFSFKPMMDGTSYLMVAMDAHAINQPEHYSKKLNLGMEWGFREIIKLQTGLHQGNLTAGAQFDVGYLNLKVTSYAEELGTHAGQDDNLTDRRFLVQLKLFI